MNYVDQWPIHIRTESSLIVNPDPDVCRAHGYELRTEEMREEDRIAAEEAALAAPFEISKFKLLKAFEGMGHLTTIVAFIEADPVRKLFWDAAVALDSDDAMIMDAKTTIQQLVPELTSEMVESILRSAQIGRMP